MSVIPTWASTPTTNTTAFTSPNSIHPHLPIRVGVGGVLSFFCLSVGCVDPGAQTTQPITQYIEVTAYVEEVLMDLVDRFTELVTILRFKEHWIFSAKIHYLRSPHNALQCIPEMGEVILSCLCRDRRKYHRTFSRSSYLPDRTT